MCFGDLCKTLIFFFKLPEFCTSSDLVLPRRHTCDTFRPTPTIQVNCLMEPEASTCCALLEIQAGVA